jgi:ADP-dependent NAD(P)H-hydrate dehydratase / NAD(P)H-hydrate epimerase
MKILSAAQMKECDQQTIQLQGIRSTDLMERAAQKCVYWLRERYQRDTLFVVICGTGNNGGDGLAIARLLHQRLFGVKAFLMRLSPELSEDCNANYLRLKNIDEELVTIIEPDTYIADLPSHVVVIDAILGSGINRPPFGWLADFIRRLNAMPNEKVAIDLPSGLSADSVPDEDNACLMARHTLSFQLYKRSFLHPESERYTGDITILDIGLDSGFIANTNTQYHYTELSDAKALLLPRSKFAHKGNFGRVLLAGGSYGKIGSMVLAATAAMRSGAGLVTALVPECGYQVMQAAIPEAMCATSGRGYLEALPNTEGYNAIGIGPGMGTEPATVAAFTDFLAKCLQPLVIDADGLNILAKYPELLPKVPAGSVITPHPKEFARLFGDNTNSMIQLDHARIQAIRYNLNIVLKGRYTAVISAEGDCWYNSTGNAGMATGGSGDVLTGIITGLKGSGYAPYAAAKLGVLLHGLAGDLAAKESSPESLIASDITRHLGKAFALVGAG